VLQGVHQYRLEVLASDVQQAVQALGHSCCTLVAHDWGGMVAWVAAGLYGRQVG
jgi:pimeloyl-ACP methyl ester carboxylesterase